MKCNIFISTVIVLITSSPVLSGQVTFPIDGGSFTVKTGEFFVSPPPLTPQIKKAMMEEEVKKTEKAKERKKLKKQLPLDFDPKIYISLYPDLEKTSKKQDDKKLWAMYHYINHGRAEQRAYTFLQFYKEYLPSDFDSILYISLYPDLKKASKHAKYKEKWGIVHYINHGQAEGRSYKLNSRL